MFSKLYPKHAIGGLALLCHEDQQRTDRQKRTARIRWMHDTEHALLEHARARSIACESPVCHANPSWVTDMSTQHCTYGSAL